MAELQLPKIFFDPTPDRRFPEYPAPPTEEEIRAMLAEDNFDCPLSQLIVSPKNQGNMDKLRSFAFGAYRRYDRNCAGQNFGIYSGPGQGKTTVVKAFAATIGIPFLLVQSDNLKTTWQLWNELELMFETAGIDLVSQGDNYHYTLPPCIVMFDEAQQLSPRLRRGGLLNAMEYDDAILKTSDPSDKNARSVVIDCSNVCWICASTDPGLIFQKSEAFYSRFTDHIIWHPASVEETAQIVYRKMLMTSKHPLPRQVCMKIAFYCKNPRQAYALARNVELQRSALNLTWDDAVEKLARDAGIDKEGMSEQQLKVLTHLGQSGPTAMSRLAIPLRCRIEEIESMILPYLLVADDRTSRPPVVAITNRGCTITEAGLKELDKRGITHRGYTVTAEHLMQ